MWNRRAFSKLANILFTTSSFLLILFLVINFAQNTLFGSSRLKTVLKSNKFFSFFRSSPPRTASNATTHHPPRQKRVLIILLDGFCRDYVQWARNTKHRPLRNLEALITRGVFALDTINVYPTVTFPNHQSLVTGLYAESHGIVNNNFRDLRVDPTAAYKYRMGNQSSLNDAAWTDGLPLPVYAENELQGGRSALVYWPASDASWGGPDKAVRPHFQIGQYIQGNKFGQYYLYAARADQMIRWLTGNLTGVPPPTHQSSARENRVNLALLYFPEPDELSHMHGPYTDVVLRELVKLDAEIGRVLAALGRDFAQTDTTTKKTTTADDVDVIVTADHGHVIQYYNRTVMLDDYLKREWYTTDTVGSVTAIWPNKGMEKRVYSALKKAPHITAYLKKDIPDEFHYKNNARIPPILAIPDLTWSIWRNKTELQKNKKANSTWGSHGYPPLQHKQMHPVFIAQGPSFKRNHTEPLLHSIDVYSLLCHLLGLEPHPHNGSFSRISNILTESAAKRSVPIREQLMSGGAAAAGGGGGAMSGRAILDGLELSILLLFVIWIVSFALHFGLTVFFVGCESPFAGGVASSFSFSSNRQEQRIKMQKRGAAKNNDKFEGSSEDEELFNRDGDSMAARNLLNT